ncbi:MAG: MBL fold metallo-hydrolase, partial [Methanolinea sp.]|nr:MBL fold metallo-hydrolase [Methanolinea sp.]
GDEKAAWAAETLYESLHHKILRLGDGVLVCPAHGAGSVCGSEISALEYTTVGFEKETNPLLSLDRSGFVKRKVHEQHYMPPYFKMMEKMNQEGAPVLSHIPDLNAYSSQEFADRRKDGVQVVDLRSPTSFGGGHIPGSVSLWRDGIPSFAGWFLNYEEPILIVDDFNLDLTQVIRHFLRLGYDNIEGYLAGGFMNWCKAGGPIESLDSLSVFDLHDSLEKGKLFLLDVRDINNRQKVGYILGSRHIYVGELPARLGELPRTHRIAIYCDAGYKGCLAASLLQRAGFTSVANILGGMTAWQKAGFAVEK